MSETPRTDTLTSKWDDDGASRGSAYMELAELARTLESELTALRSQVAELQRQLYIATAENERQQSLIDDQLRTIVALNDCIGGKGSLTTDNLLNVARRESECPHKWQLYPVAGEGEFCVKCGVSNFNCDD